MRKKLIIANWKMNLSYAEALALTDAIVSSVDNNIHCNIIISPPYIYLHDIVSRLQSQPNFSIAAQNCSNEERGAFTGEVSAFMLSSIGVEYVIVGHSERRTIYGESDEMISQKIERALNHGLMPVFCCGENLEQRKNKNHFEVVEAQLSKGLFHVNGRKINECIVAYEPVWAIGTGVNASAVEAQEMHAFIRSKLQERYRDELDPAFPILYGGSLNAKNADELFACPDVDGGLVGGASLKSNEFLSIIQSMNSLTVK